MLTRCIKNTKNGDTYRLMRHVCPAEKPLEIIFITVVIIEVMFIDNDSEGCCWFENKPAPAGLFNQHN